MFDYNHVSKDEEFKKKDFEKEVDDLFSRKPRRLDDDRSFFERADRFSKELPSRDYERRMPREEPRDWRDESRDLRDDYRGRPLPRDEYDDRRRFDTRYEERRRDDRDKYVRREDIYRDRDRDRELGRDRDLARDRESGRDRDLGRDKDLGRDRDMGRDRYRDSRRDDSRNRSKSREKDSRKRGRSRENDIVDHSKKSKENETKSNTDPPKHIIMVDDLLEPPGRDMRPEKIVVILRGLYELSKSFFN